MSAPDIPRDDLAAAVDARQELGRDSEREVVDAFLDRVEAAIDARVDERLARRAPQPPERAPSRPSVALALGSMGIGIAVTGAASGLDDGEPVAIIAWLVIAAINIAHALRS